MGWLPDPAFLKSAKTAWVVLRLKTAQVAAGLWQSRQRTKAFSSNRSGGVGTRTASKHTPALSTKRSNFREKADPAGLRSAHLASNGEAKHRWELQSRRYSRPQGLGHRPPFACASRRLAHDHPLRPAKADLVEVEICVVRADVVEHTRDGTAHPVVEALR